MISTQTSTVTEVRTLVITLAVGGAFAIAAAFVYGWQTLDQRSLAAPTRSTAAALAPDIVEIPRN